MDAQRAGHRGTRRQLGWIKKEKACEKAGDGESHGRSGPGEVVVAEEDESGFVKLRKKSWARLISKVYLEDPEICPSCGKEMRVIAALTSPHQDRVIERILRARGEWDPPWKRERKARGPPAEREVAFSPSPDEPAFPLWPTEEEFSQVRAESEDEFNQLPPPFDEISGQEASIDFTRSLIPSSNLDSVDPTSPIADNSVMRRTVTVSASAAAPVTRFLAQPSSADTASEVFKLSYRLSSCERVSGGACVAE